ncbi:MAG TPA: hypothetical protein V6C71_25075 [Coleofasciculaceae cyanobacterium]|jgi:hypothetical protein
MQFLVIARVAEDTSPNKVFPYVKPEAEKVWKYYAANVVRSIHYIADMSGAVLILEAENLSTAEEIVAELPMAKNDILDFEILPLTPYTGLEALFS